MNPTAERCDQVLRITKAKNFEKHTCYNCVHLSGLGDGVTDSCDKGYKIKMFLFKFGWVKDAVYHRDNKSWVCRDKKV